MGQPRDRQWNPQGTEFQVNTYTNFNQYNPDIAMAPDGAFVVVWSSLLQDGNDLGIFGQRFDSSGSALGTEFQVNTYTPFGQILPAVAAAANGDFVVVWTDGNSDQDSSLSGIFGQRFASGGSALGTEFQVNTYTSFRQSDPAVAASSNGDFVVTWGSFVQDDSNFGIFGQHYASGGSALGTEFRVNTHTDDSQVFPTVAWSANGDFVVAWESDDQDGDYSGIFGQRYSDAPPAAGCAAEPLMGCATAGKSNLLIKDKGENGAGPKDKLLWKWLKGPATMQADFSNPTTTANANYNFCIYSGTAQALTASVPVGPPWQAISTKGYKYKDTAATVDGIKQIQLKGGAAGKSKILVKGKDGGLDLDASTLPFGMATVTVQLSNTDSSNCWQSTFAPAAAKKNTDGQFKAKTP